MHEVLDWFQPVLSDFKARRFTAALEACTAQLRRSQRAPGSYVREKSGGPGREMAQLGLPPPTHCCSGLGRSGCPDA